MMIALFPPNSNKERPKRSPTAAPTDLPIRVDPVAEINGTRPSFAINFPISASPMITLDTPSGTPFASKTSCVMR